jgi:hypothetical protein
VIPAELARGGVIVDRIFVDDTGDRLVPVHGVGEAGVGADGFDVGRGGELDVVAALENIFESEEIIAAALLVEAGGMGVAIEDAAVLEFELFGDPPGTAPVNELFFDLLAIGVTADDAFATVAVERSSCFGFAEELRRGCEAGFWVLGNLLILWLLWHVRFPLGPDGRVWI